jgi:hypothetical protein
LIEFSPQEYGPAFAALLADAPLNVLGPGRPQVDKRSGLETLTITTAFDGSTIHDQSMAECCLSGAWLLFDFLDESHVISQQIPTTTGSYWHGIMHRREGDFSNSKYWFRRVGDHPLFAALGSAAAELDTDEQLFDGKWDPYRFVDLVEAATRGGDEKGDLPRRVAQAEWQLLFDYCYRTAIGVS